MMNIFFCSSEENQKNWMEKLMSTSAAAPSESVRLAMTTLSQQQQQQQSSSEQLRMMNHPVSEPLYENVQLNNGADGAGQNAAVNNSGSPETRLSVQRQSVEQPKVRDTHCQCLTRPSHKTTFEFGGQIS